MQRRRKNFGAGLVHLHKQAGVTEESYAVGLWCQNRPEWQITGMWDTSIFAESAQDLHCEDLAQDTPGACLLRHWILDFNTNIRRSRMHVTAPFHRLAI